MKWQSHHVTNEVTEGGGDHAVSTGACALGCLLPGTMVARHCRTLPQAHAAGLLNSLSICFAPCVAALRRGTGQSRSPFLSPFLG